ncbi:MAG: ABC transporter substrate-binding protein, partial [Cyanobacteria bacterium P01_E01_bin.43]
MPTENHSSVVDAVGAEIGLRQAAKRVVCLTATGIDILAELELMPVGYLAKGIADRPEFYGAAAQHIASVGSWMRPQMNSIKQLQPDLIIGWAFPHRFYKPWLDRIAPVYLMSGSGYETTLQRLRDVGTLCDRTLVAERAIVQLEHTLAAHQRLSTTQAPKTVLMMGGSTLNRWLGKFLIETDRGTVGSLLQRLTHYPWPEPANHRGEPGFMTYSLPQIVTINPDVIFVQTYPPAQRPLSQQLARHPLWNQLTAVQTHQVYEVDQFWHMGTGTRMLNLIL